MWGYPVDKDVKQIRDELIKSIDNDLIKLKATKSYTERRLLLIEIYLKAKILTIK